jgi:hypothetical protein
MNEKKTNVVEFSYEMTNLMLPGMLKKNTNLDLLGLNPFICSRNMLTIMNEEIRVVDMKTIPVVHLALIYSEILPHLSIEISNNSTLWMPTDTLTPLETAPLMSVLHILLQMLHPQYQQHLQAL